MNRYHFCKIPNDENIRTTKELLNATQNDIKSAAKKHNDSLKSAAVCVCAPKEIAENSEFNCIDLLN